MTLTTQTPGASGITPNAYTELIVEAIQKQSVALDPRVTRMIQTDSAVTHVPVIREDAAAAWVAEGATINATDAALDELEVRPAKVAGLSRISRELANDSSPAATGIVGQSLARDIARKIDQAFFGNLPTPAPAGLESIPPATFDPLDEVIDNGHLTVQWGATAAPTNLDAFAEALSLADALGSTLTAFVADPSTALALSVLRDETGSNRPLLGTDATSATTRQILGVPLIVSSHVEAGTVWGLDASRTLTIVREGVTIASSGDVYFDSDAVAIRATARVGFAFPSLRSIIKLQATD